MDSLAYVKRRFCTTRESIDIVIDRLERMGTLWRGQPEEYFGPGEVLVHIAHVGEFTLRFVRQQAGVDPQVELPEPFRSAAHRQARLRSLNLISARQVVRNLCGFPAFKDWMQCRLQRIQASLNGIPLSVGGREVSHPLVDMRCPAADMLHRQLNEHAIAHLAQIIDRMKVRGLASVTPHLPVYGILRQEQQ